MKYKARIIVIMLLIMLISTVAFAGIIDTVKGFISDKVIEMVIAGVFLVISTFFGGAALKWKKTVTEGSHILKAIWDSIQEDSPGGSNITKEEFEKILTHGGHAGAAALIAFKTKTPS